jgi:hypothetical protein
VGTQESLEGQICLGHQYQAPSLHLQKNNDALPTVSKNGCVISEMQSVFIFLEVRSEFEYRSFISFNNGNKALES